MTNDGTTIHGTAVQIWGKGILLRGASGSGKSSIGLRLVDDCQTVDNSGYLVADDRVVLAEKGATLIASGPKTLRGLIEIRGVGILEIESLPRTTLDLLVDLVPHDVFERYPSDQDIYRDFGSIRLPRVQIQERNPDATTIIRTFLRSTRRNPTITTIDI